MTYEAGFEMGRNWIGPNGDGSMGSISDDFVREAAERAACGYRFNELRDGGPTDEERRRANAFMRGFHAARLTR